MSSPDSKIQVPSRPLRPAVFSTVSALTPGSRGHNLRVSVQSVAKLLDEKKDDGTHFRISEALVGDSTATILLTLRGTQTESPIIKPNGYLYLRNTRVEMYRGHMRLAVDKWGVIEEIPEGAERDKVGKAKTNNNLSDQEYELVEATEKTT